MLIEELKKKLRIVLGQENLDPKLKFIDLLRDLDAYLRVKDEALTRELKHFLRQRSYEKAYNYITGNNL